jgi:hypothetical protein
MGVALKACERCGGDMSYEIDIYGAFRQCLQCSYLEDLPLETAAEAATRDERRPEPAAVSVRTHGIAKEASDVS